MSATSPKPQHWLELDGVRGAAIVLVFAFHCLPAPQGDFFPIDAALTLKASFWFGVDLFFVLSGFLITGILIDSRDASNRFQTFYARRTLRIFPLYYFGLLFTFVILPLLVPDDLAIGETAPPAWFLTYAFNIFLAIQQSWPEAPVLNHFWSLCVEEQFYLVWPFVIWFTADRHLPKVMIGTIAFAIIVKISMGLASLEPVALYTSMPARMDSFACGGLMAWLHRFAPAERVTFPARATFYSSAIALIALAIPGRGLHLDSAWVVAIGIPLLAVFFATLIYLVLHPVGEFRQIRHLFRQSSLRWLGRYSYGIYVYHWIVQYTVIRNDAFGWRSENPWWNTFLVAITTLLIARLSFLLIEAPFLNLKKRFQPRAG